MEKELQGQVALVTGAAGAIGRAVSNGFLQAGAYVTLVDIDQARLERFEEELSARYAKEQILAVAADVKDSEQVKQAFDATVDTFGRLHILVNNAAVTQINPVDMLSDEDIDLIIDTDLKGYIKCAREAVKIMKRTETRGALLFISSKNGLLGAAKKCLYSAAKGGGLTMARALAKELGPFGIRVNTICPDAVMEGSYLWREGGGYLEGTAERYNIAVEEIPDYYKNRCALKTKIDPVDVANAAVFLVSSRSAKITGAILSVDGGVAFVR